MALDILITTDPSGSPQRLAGLGPIVGIFPAHRAADGTWLPPQLDRQPLSFGGHRDGDTVEILGLTVAPEGAAELGLADETWLLVRCRYWYRTPEKDIVRTVRDVAIYTPEVS